MGVKRIPGKDTGKHTHTHTHTHSPWLVEGTDKIQKNKIFKYAKKLAQVVDTVCT